MIVCAAMRTKSKDKPAPAELGILGLDDPAAPAMGAALTNAPEFTVSDLSGALKRTVEERFGYVRVRGEVSNYRGPHASGHAYFSLKDTTARIDAVVWRTAFARMRIKPEEGMEVVASGKITTFPGNSTTDFTGRPGNPGVFACGIDSVGSARPGADLTLALYLTSA